MTLRTLSLFFAFTFLAAGTARPSATSTDGKPPPPREPAPAEPFVGVAEKLGARIPGELVFRDENGAPRTLRELVDRPTILALVFYHCPGICGMIQGNLARVLKDVPGQVGADYRLLSLSFDDEEPFALAAEARRNYTGLAQPPLPADAWHFLTGDTTNIARLCEAVGFHYVKISPHNFTHPALITVLAKDGTVIRYLYGTDYLPLDIGMALSEATQGTPGLSIRKFVTYCYSYDPKSGRYVFALFRVVGLITLVTLAGLILFLRYKPSRRRPPDPTP